MIKTIFWNGLKAFVPMALTFAIVMWLFTFTESFFGKLVRYVIPEKYYFTGLGIIVGMLFIFAFGVVVNAWLIKQIYQFADRIVDRIPFIKSIYNALKDLVSFFDKGQDTSHQQTVLVDTPLGKMIGVITQDSLSKMPFSKEGEDNILVYLSLSYMIGGVVIVVPRNSVTPFGWSAETALSFVMTAGMIKSKN